MKYLYISFYTSSEAMETEAICKENNLAGKLVPVPRSMSAGCGMARRTDISLKEETLKLLEREDVEIENHSVL